MPTSLPFVYICVLHCARLLCIPRISRLLGRPSRVLDYVSQLGGRDILHCKTGYVVVFFYVERAPIPDLIFNILLQYLNIMILTSSLHTARNVSFAGPGADRQAYTGYSGSKAQVISKAIYF